MSENVFQALAEPRRRAILAALAAGELTAGEVAGHFEISRQAVSQHLGVLREAGLVSVRAEGTRRFYAARPEGTEDARAFLDGLWNGGLARLAEAAEREQRDGRERRAAERN